LGIYRNTRDRLFPTDVARATVRLALLRTLTDLDMDQDRRRHGEPLDYPVGYFSCVPLLEGVHPAVQVGVLARLWHFVQMQRPVQVNVLGGAAVYSALLVAADFAHKFPDMAQEWLREPPRPVLAPVIEGTSDGWRRAYEAW
jgi:hypothetical protein